MKTPGSEIRKTRPCIVMSVKMLIEKRRTVIVVPLSSSTKASPPILMPISCGEFPSKESAEEATADGHYVEAGIPARTHAKHAQAVRKAASRRKAPIARFRRVELGLAARKDRPGMAATV